MTFLAPFMLQLFVLFVRPQEIWPALQPLQLIYLTLLGTVIGFYQAAQQHEEPMQASPQMPYVQAFFGWALVTLLVNAPGMFSTRIIAVTNSFLFFTFTSMGLRSFRDFERLAVFLLFLLLALAALGVHQGFAPQGCIEAPEYPPTAAGEFNGQYCDAWEDCIEHGEPDHRYRCEHLGLLGTTSIAGRVRYRGLLEDPNELSLATTLVLPFAFALYQRKRSFLRLVLVVVTVATIATCSVMSQSRGGQLVFLTVMGVYGVRLLGVFRGALFGSVFMVPMLMLGGRNSEDAEESSLERLGCWKEGIQMFRTHPVFGVGTGQFTEHHFLTAHNSYVLVVGEQGFLGFLLFLSIVYLSLKTTLLALRRLSRVEGPEAEIARIWITAVFAAMAGATVGIFFLSLAYHPVIWVFFGLTAAIVQLMRRLAPEFEVRISAAEVAGVTTFGLVVLAAVWVYASKKGA